MQNKLNEILELCIEKSSEDIFYSFIYDFKLDSVCIKKYSDDAGERKQIDGRTYPRHYFESALEYMQNE